MRQGTLGCVLGNAWNHPCPHYPKTRHFQYFPVERASEDSKQEGEGVEGLSPLMIPSRHLPRYQSLSQPSRVREACEVVVYYFS